MVNIDEVRFRRLGIMTDKELARYNFQWTIINIYNLTLHGFLLGELRYETNIHK